MVSSLDFVTILLIALGLSADCFAIAVGGSISIKSFSTGQMLRTSLAFGLSQALMPVFGWLAGRTVVDLIAAYDHWVAFTLLGAVGGRMIWESFRTSHSYSDNMDITRGLTLFALSVATSIDALAVGLSFAFVEVNIVLASLIIGLVAFVATTIGFLIGRRSGRLVGRRAETIGGMVLIAIGLRILVSHIV